MYTIFVCALEKKSLTNLYRDVSICEGSSTDCMEAIFGLTGVLEESTITLSFLATGTKVGELCSGVVSTNKIIHKNNLKYNYLIPIASANDSVSPS